MVANCRLYWRGTHVVLTASSASYPQTFCNALARQWSTQGDFWSHTGALAPYDRPVCKLRGQGLVIRVLDDFGQFNGDAVCSALIQSGFQEITHT